MTTQDEEINYKMFFTKNISDDITWTSYTGLFQEDKFIACSKSPYLGYINVSHAFKDFNVPFKTWLNGDMSVPEECRGTTGKDMMEDFGDKILILKRREGLDITKGVYIHPELFLMYRIVSDFKFSFKMGRIVNQELLKKRNKT